jgi:hypothetical protein
MKIGITLLVFTALCSRPGFAVPKVHVVAFGKWTAIKVAEDDEATPVEMKTRPLLVDGRTKEFTVGPAHDVMTVHSTYSTCTGLTTFCRRKMARLAGVGSAVGGCWWIV